LAKARSWNFQKSPPSAATVTAASAAGRALLWNGRGLFFQTTRTLSGPYSFLIRSTVGSTREQNGHSKSLASTIVTGASALPHMGSSAPIGTGEVAWLLSPLPFATSALTWTPPRSWAMPHINPIPAKKLKRKPTNAVPLFMILVS